MANNFASIKIILISWWSVFLIGLEDEWIYTINIAMLFLMLVSEITITELGFRWGIEDKIVKIVTIGSFALLIIAISFVKWKITRKNVN